MRTAPLAFSSSLSVLVAFPAAEPFDVSGLCRFAVFAALKVPKTATFAPFKILLFSSPPADAALNHTPAPVHTLAAPAGTFAAIVRHIRSGCFYAPPNERHSG